MKTVILFSGNRYSFHGSSSSAEISTIHKTAPLISLNQIEQIKSSNEASFNNENIEGFRKVIDIAGNQNEIDIILQYIDGKNLREKWTELVQLSDKINLCLRIAKQLSKVHNQQILHLNLQPEHILIENKSDKIYFISLGLSKRILRKEDEQVSQLYTNAHPDYIAPEQTGRISAEIGYSSDIYSLGVIFYELFTGHLPFKDKEDAAKIHAHIAIRPVSPHTISDIPEILSLLIMKMLEKDIEKRYHSADGIAHDLSVIMDTLEKKDKTEIFELGKQDSSGLLRSTNLLFGRDKQIEKMKSVYHKVLSGKKELLLVYGHSGTGKTSLVNHLNRTVSNDGGIFASGKFDSLKTDVPYSAMAQAFGRMMEQIELSGQDQLRELKDELQKVLHPIGRALFDIVPGLERLLPEEPELPVLNGNEAQQRFNYAFINFLQTISLFNKSIVLFLDDLQWSDSSSLTLLRNILSNDSLRNILVIGAYRDNEITVGHFFLQFKLEIEKRGILPEEIHLENLTSGDIEEFIKYITGSTEPYIHELVSLIQKKSGGNALFVNQFVKAIYENKMMYFDRADRKWKWDNDKILSFNLEGDIVNLMLDTINKLKQDSIHVLKIASCIGNKFPIQILAQVTGQTTGSVQDSLKPAINNGLIIDTADTDFYFVHDRVQQALYSLTEDDQKKLFHLEIGRLIFQKTDETNVRDSIFDIVNQFNFAKSELTDTDERNKISQLNIIAGNRSQTATAYSLALQYYENAIELISGESWESDYVSAFSLYLRAAMAANQCNNQERFDELISILDLRINNSLDKLKVADLKIQNAIAGSNHTRVIDIGLQVLRIIGIKIKRKPSQIDVLTGYIFTNFRLKKFSEDEILKLPLLKDEALLTAMVIMHRVAYASYFIEPNAVPLIMFELIKLTLKNGLGPKSPIAFIVFGYINIAYMNKTLKGIQFGELGNKLSELLQHEDQISSIKQAYHTFIAHYTMHLGKAIPDIEKGFRKGLETGDFEFTAILGQFIMYWSVYAGEPLQATLKRGQLLNMQVAPLNQVLTHARINLFTQSVNNLIYGVNDFEHLQGDIYDEKSFDFPDEPAYNLYYHNINMQKKFLAIVFNQDEVAWKNCCREKEYLIPVKGTITELLFYFYESICITPIFNKQTESEQARLLKICRKNLKLFKELSNLYDINFLHRYQLMLAEYSVLTGRNDEAMKYYTESIKNARLHKYVHDEALAWERTAIFYQANNQAEVARFYFSHTYKTYSKWGASAKLEQMKTQYAGFLSMEEIGIKSTNLDLNTVLKTIHLISGEMNLENLLVRLMNLLTENAGAERAFLIIKENGKLSIKASVDASGKEVKVLQEIDFEKYQSISHSVINSVIRSGEILVLDNASETMPYAHENYISKNEIKSIVCIPLKQVGEAFAFLYLENNLIAGAFTKERIEILQVMATQTAISLQNTMLFEQTNHLNTVLSQEIEGRKMIEEDLRINKKRLEDYNLNLENKVLERTRALNSEKEKSDELLLNILPYNIAMELKDKGSAEAKQYNNVTVLFTDFVNFTGISERLPPTELVAAIHKSFTAFDAIMEKHGLEKIKTIGDAYLAVSGMPDENENHARQAVNAALDILEFIHQSNSLFRIRIGIHSGPVVAGIVGVKKYAYDIWGDTVNTAARMEQHSEPGKINISGATHSLLNGDFECEYRGKIPAKNKGDVDMYFVERKSEV